MAYDSPIRTDRAAIIQQFRKVRADSMAIAAPLTPEDWMLQSMPDASPVKWNLAHTSWFFETFILKPHHRAYEEFHPQFSYLFNSYYNAVGSMHPRPNRGMISRPSADEVCAYRRHVDGAVEHFIESADDAALEAAAPLMALGFGHEEQHQELMLTDLKHGLYMNPLLPGVYEEPADKAPGAAVDLDWKDMEGGLCEIGSDGAGFAFDSEGPRHKVFLHPFRLANRPVTNGEFIAFMDDGGYENAKLWLSDAWELVCEERWSAPLYWRKDGEGWREYTLFGERAVNPHAPVCHVSFFEAAAYAGWAGARLPTEFEWEAAASLNDFQGNFLEGGVPRAPKPAAGANRLLQLFGDVWEWTASPYIAYPGYAPPAGAIGEYNGKFMSGQMVLRGGSCATPAGHMRLSYRNFFPPNARWQFSGFRLAQDL